MVPQGARARYPSILGPSTLAADADPPFFGDLVLDQLLAGVTADRGDYRIDGFFRVPLTDPAAVKFRHGVFRDLEQTELRVVVDAFCRSMLSMRGALRLAEARRGYLKSRQRWFLEAVSYYCRAVDDLGLGLSQVSLESEGWQAVQGFVDAYRHSDDFTALQNETTSVAEILDSLTVSVRLQGGRITVRRFDEAPDYSAEVLATFDRFRQGAVQHRPAKKDASPLDVNHVEDAVIEMAARLHPDEFAHLADFCSRQTGFADPGILTFDREVQFYLAYLDFIADLRASGLSFCYPEVATEPDRVWADEAFDLALADNLRRNGSSEQVVPNDFALRTPEHILVVSGPNQGGKTTFARMIGQLHFLGSLGCPVPGAKARLLLFDQLFTHFEREETLVNLSGKLEDDLVRIQAILLAATSSSLIIVNEIFSSTTLDDALFLSREVLDKVIDLGALCVIVTFIDELSTIGPATVSMVSSVDEGDLTRRTYRIVRRPPEGLAYAAAIADKYRLSYRALRERIHP